MFDAIMTAFANLADIKIIGLILGGVAIGMMGGALPGISPSITIALLLPVTFSLDPLYGLVALGAIYMAAEYGGPQRARSGSPACSDFGFKRGRLYRRRDIAVIYATAGRDVPEVPRP
jgi:hypothetical protein